MSDQVVLRIPEVQANLDEPFKDDLFGRGGSASVLTELVRRMPGPCVLAIDSPWGTGKSTFLRMWRTQLEKEGFGTISFSAWESDFAEDPFVALASEMTSAMESMSAGPTLRKQVRKARQVASSIARRAIPAVAKVATAGLVDLNEMAEAALSGLVEDLTKDQIERYEKSKTSLEAFRKALGGAVAALAEASKTSLPLVFCIDELDRCRPTFAISLLEKIKHLFSVPGVVFVLAWDKQQLTSSVRSVYGSDFDAHGYLRRFVDFEYVLPEPSYELYVPHLLEHLGIDANLSLRPRDAKSGGLPRFLTALFTAYSLSAREQIHCISRIALALRTVPSKQFLFEHELAILVVLREWRPELFKLVREGGRWHDPVLAELSKGPGGQRFLSSADGALLKAILVAGAAELGDVEPTNRYTHVINDGGPRGDEARGMARRLAGLSEAGLGNKRFLITLRRLLMNEAFVTTDPKAESE